MLKVIAGDPSVYTTLPLAGCQSLVGCYVASINTNAAGTKMIGNPFGFDVDWSNVRIRVGGSGGTIYTPSEAVTANIVSNQFWIWNGNTYNSWNDSSNPGSLLYSKSFFVRVLPGGVSQTIDLLIPVRSSSLTTGSLTKGVVQRVAELFHAATQVIGDILFPPAAAQTAPTSWKVTLRVEDPAKGFKASAVLGKFPGSQAQFDPNDLSAMAPFARPWLTLVFPRTNWGARSGDYSGDFRPVDAAAAQWPLEVRADRAGGQLVLKWEGDPAILRRSRLKDNLTGRVIDLTAPAFANGYPLTLNTATRQLTWEYLGD